MDNQSGDRDIVVGVDDSESARAALTWAADHARAVGSPLRAIHVFSDRTPSVAWAPGVPGMGYVVEGPSPADIADRMGRLFGQVHPDPDWTLEFEHGPIGRVLVERSQRAAALVLGTRDHVGIDRLLVGSVSHYCLSHASCPVVAVPATPVQVPAAERVLAAQPSNEPAPAG